MNKNKLTNENKKNILTNIFSLSTIELFNKLFPIISIPLVIKAIGLESYGHYVVFTSIAFLGMTVVDYGIKLSGVRDVTRVIDNIKELRRYYVEIQSMRVILLFIYLSIITIYYLLSEFSLVGVLLVGVILLCHIYGSDWFYLSISRSKNLIIPSFITKITQLVLIVVFVKKEDDYQLLLLCYSLPSLLSCVYLVYHVRNNYKVSFFKFDIRLLMSNLRTRLDIFITVLIPNFWNALPLIVVGTLYPGEEFSSVAIVIQITSVIFVFQNIFSRSIFPIYVKKSTSSLLDICKLNLILILPIVFFVSVFGKGLVDFLLSVEIDGLSLATLAVSLVFTSLANALSIGFFLPLNLDAEYRNSLIITSIFSTIFTCIIISTCGVPGVIWALFLSRFIVLIGLFHSYLRVK